MDMDYFELLHKAQMNNKNVGSKDPSRCYKATFTAPKKTEKSRVSSANIQRFLARKEEEEKKKHLEAQKKKEDLLALRALDKKSQKRVQVMLKRTKSANKSVMEDAIDNYNTKDTLEGPKQCDEDDYGYVSQEASAFYEKLMAKYEKGPTESTKQMTREVKDLQAAKDRVKAALDREAEELLHPVRKRKRKHGDGESETVDGEEGEGNDSNEVESKKDKREKEPEEPKERPKKIVKKAPPPVDFFELMKIAAKKQHEPIVIEKKKVEEPGRPMTMKEKLERQKEMDRKNKKSNPAASSTAKPSTAAKDESSKAPSKTILKSSSDRAETSKSKSIAKNKSDINSNNLSPQTNLKKSVKFGQNVEKPTSSPILKNSLVRDKNGSVDARSKPSNNNSSMPSTTPKSNSKVDDEPKNSSPKVDVSDIDREIEMLMKKKRMLMEAQTKSQSPVQRVSSQNSREPIPNKPSSKTPASKPSMNAPTKKPSLDVRDKVPVKGNLKEGNSLPGKVVKPESRPLPGKLPPQRAEPVSGKLPPQRSESVSGKLPPQRSESASGKLPPQRSESASGKLPPQRLEASPRKLPPQRPEPSPQRRLPPPYGGPPRKLPPSHMMKKKRVIDSESEYDSEMDDFIDDGPDESMDYSSHIKAIFGYDKSRYAHIDEDECEESNYRTQMIEEKRSAKIGLMEDLEDIQREKEEKARAKMKKKMSGKR